MANHIVEMPIYTEPWEESAIEKRFQAAKEVYNAVLGEYLKRVDLARDSIAFKKADNPSEVFKEYGVKFTQKMPGDVRREVIPTGESWLYNHLAANTMDSIAKRAAQAVEKWIYQPSSKGWVYGKKGRPKFKTATLKNPMYTIRSSNGFDYHNTTLKWSTAKGGNDPLFLKLGVTDRDRLSLGDIPDHPLVTVKRKRIKGGWRYFCQIVCNGHPPMTADIDPAHGKRVGVDVGVLRVAVVSEDDARMFELGKKLQPRWDEIRRLDRKLDRQKRANNPDKFFEDGQVKPRESWEKDWVWSKGYKETREKRRDAYRYYQEHRKRIHEKTANAILEMGTDIVVETRRYKWAQQIGRGSDIRENGPAMFVETLAYKAASVGGRCTKTDHLSRRCLCGEKSDLTRPLEYRCDECGHACLRPILSAFLARHYVPADEEDEQGKVDAIRARERWVETAARLEEPASTPLNRSS